MRFLKDKVVFFIIAFFFHVVLVYLFSAKLYILYFFSLVVFGYILFKFYIYFSVKIFFALLIVLFFSINFFNDFLMEIYIDFDLYSIVPSLISEVMYTLFIIHLLLLSNLKRFRFFWDIIDKKLFRW